MGRGGKNNNHIGNAKLRSLARRRIMQYSHSTKKGKATICISLAMEVFSMSPGGRFIKKDKHSGQWLRVSTRQLLEKVGRVMRDAVAKYRCISEPASLRHPRLGHHPSHLVSPSSSVSAEAQRKRRPSDMPPSTCMVFPPKRQRLSPITLSPNKAHSLTIFNEHQKQKHDATTNDNSSFICSGRTLTRSNRIGASRNDGLSGFKSSPLMKKPSNPDRVSTCESFTSNESRGSTIPTGQPQRVAMVMPSTETSLLFYPFSYQQHHGITQHHTDYSCCSTGNVPVKLHSWDTPHRAEKKDPSSSLTRDEEEKEWATNLTFASQSTGCAKPAVEEEEEGLDLVTYSRLKAIFLDDSQMMQGGDSSGKDRYLNL